MTECGLGRSIRTREEANVVEETERECHVSGDGSADAVASRRGGVASDGNHDGRPALVLMGGGARAAYQVGFLRCLARRMPELNFPIIVGSSSGAINAAHLASRPGPLPGAVDELVDLWRGLSPSSVMKVDPVSFAKNVVVWGIQLLSGGRRIGPEARSLVDCSPLVRLLREHLAGADGDIFGIRRNLREGRLEAVAVSTTCYTTSDSVTFVQGRSFPDGWNRAGRVGIETALTVDHVLASSALPFLFSAIRIGRHWHGDGAIRLSSPLSPAIGLGADRIVVVSTERGSDDSGSETPDSDRYPPPAMIAGNLLHAMMQDRLTDDVRRLRRLNRVLDEGSRRGATGEGDGSNLRRVGVFVLRPSEDLGKLARGYESRLPRPLRFMIRGLGTQEMESPSLLSMLLFEPEYLKEVMEIGERDAETRGEDLRRFLTADDPARVSS